MSIFISACFVLGNDFSGVVVKSPYDAHPIKVGLSPVIIDRKFPTLRKNKPTLLKYRKQHCQKFERSQSSFQA